MDIEDRVADAEVNPANTRIESREFAKDGVVLKRNEVAVRRLTVDHDPGDAIEPAVGYRSTSAAARSS